MLSDNYTPLFNVEPVFNCPSCGVELHTDWVDNGFGSYSVQASPYGCECGWHETGCETCIKEKCFSWEKCQGRALKQNDARSIQGTHHMTTDPREPGQPEEQATETQPEVIPDSEEGNTEG